jgi:Family of unknown function (DUF5681)
MKGKPRLTGKRSDTLEVSDRDGAAEVYRVGPGRPPREYQFKPGQSGNPKGAGRKGPSIVPDLKAVLERALSKKVTLRQGEKQQIVTMATAGIEHLVAQYAKGDRHARRDVFDLAQKLGVDITAGQSKPVERARTDLTAEDKALLADFLQRHRSPREHHDSDADLPRSEEAGDTNPGRK